MTTENVDPELRPVLNALGDIWGDTSMDLSDLAQARQMHDAMTAKTNSIAANTEGVETSRRVITSAAGNLDVVIYVHEPLGESDSDRSVLLHIHGGGFVTGSAAHAEPQLRALSKQFDCMVVSVDYRLAPEHPFPAGLLDCFTALQWLSDEAGALNIDPTKIVVLGESAGGGLAAGLALYARDHSEIEIAQQVLLYPMLDYRNILLSSESNSDAFIWNRKNNQFGWAAYLGEAVDDSMLAYASPSYAEDWSDLPPTYVCVGDIDLFHEENCVYVDRLRNSGVKAEIDVYPGAYHAFQVLVPQAAVSQNCVQKLDLVLGSALT